MAEAARKPPVLELAATPRQSTLRIAAARTVVMPARPLQPPPPPPVKSPAARSVELPSIAPDRVVFEGELLARVDDFVRLRLHARSVTFLGVLQREGVSREYYAMMCERFDAARAADPSLEATYRARLALATGRPR